MSRQPMLEEARPDQHGPSEMARRVDEAYLSFRESRLYAQVLAALCLVGMAGLVALLPAGPTARIRAALAWTVNHDYDFRGAATRAHSWAAGSGGWLAAVNGVFVSGTQRIKQWAAPLVPSTDSGTAATTGLDWPVKGAVLHEFGWLPREVAADFHEGIDILARVGTPVTAVANGSVVRITAEPGLGNLIQVDHGSVIALYAEVDAIRVRAGDRVKKGQVLAVVARPAGSERGFKPHLHFEIMAPGNGQPVNPLPYLKVGGNLF